MMAVEHQEVPVVPGIQQTPTLHPTNKTSIMNTMILRHLRHMEAQLPTLRLLVMVQSLHRLLNSHTATHHRPLEATALTELIRRIQIHLHRAIIKVGFRTSTRSKYMFCLSHRRSAAR